MWQNVYDEMQNGIKNIQLYEGLSSMEELSDWGVEKGHNIFALNDLMIQGVDSEQLIDMMCVGNHHSNMTVIFFLQNVFQKVKPMRTASLSCHYFILFDSKRDPSQIATLCRQIFPGNNTYFMSAYQAAIYLKPFNILLVDLTNLISCEQTSLQDTIVYQPAKLKKSIVNPFCIFC